MKREYRVEWSTTIEATTPLKAAERAWKHMRDDGSTANVFRVNGKEVDLCHAYGEAGRPEDLADLAPELLRALQGVMGWIEAGCDPSTKSVHGAQMVLAAARKVKK